MCVFGIAIQRCAVGAGEVDAQAPGAGRQDEDEHPRIRVEPGGGTEWYIIPRVCDGNRVAAHWWQRCGMIIARIRGERLDSCPMQTLTNVILCGAQGRHQKATFGVISGGLSGFNGNEKKVGH